MKRFPSTTVIVAVLVTALSGATSVPCAAQTPRIELSPIACIRTTSHQAVAATIDGEAGVYEARTNFRWQDRANFYYVVMAAAGNGAFWSALPKPEEQNEAVEVYVSAHDTSGRTLARSATVTIPVRDECSTALSSKQQGYADNLTIGETAAVQRDKSVLGFLCDGIVTRIGADGILRSDSICRACVIAAAAPAPAAPTVVSTGVISGFLIGGGIIGGIIISDDEPPEASPSRP